MSKKAGNRICPRCGVEREHGAGQTYCRECHREIARLAAPAGVRECGGCGALAEHSAGASRCRTCRAEAAKEKRRSRREALKVVRSVFAERVED